MRVQPAIHQHGAKAVYAAACKAMEGDYSHLQKLGVEAKTLGDAFRAQSSAYKSMTASERASEQMNVNADLKKHGNTGNQNASKGHDTHLNIRVPVESKAAWVKAAAGRPLTEWVIEKLDAAAE